MFLYVCFSKKKQKTQSASFHKYIPDSAFLDPSKDGSESNTPSLYGMVLSSLSEPTWIISIFE